MSEMAEAVVLEDDDDEFDEDSRLHSPETLIHLGHGLIDLDTRSGTVSLTHPSGENISHVAMDQAKLCSRLFSRGERCSDGTNEEVSQVHHLIGLNDAN